MHSYETLAILVLALSAASPAFSAPVREGQQQARANVDERSFATSLGKTGLISAATGALPVLVEHFLGDGGSNNSRRALPRDTDLTPATLRVDGFPLRINNGGPDTSLREPSFDGLEQRAPGLKDVFDKAVDRVESEVHDHTRREPSPLSLGKLGQKVTDAVDRIKSKVHDHTRREPSPLSLGNLGSKLGSAGLSFAVSEGTTDLLKHFNLTRREPEPSPLNLATGYYLARTPTDDELRAQYARAKLPCHQKQDWRSHKEYCRKVKAAGANTFDAILFAVNETKPRLVKIPWQMTQDEDDPTPWQNIDIDSWFKHTDRWGINGPGLGRRLCFWYDDNFLRNGLPLNRCIVEVTGGRAGHPWCGNIVALRLDNSCPLYSSSDIYTNMDMKEDLKPLVTYFEEYGTVMPA
ncbi:hypothetical protein EI94DRAFT_1701620 [Lactarius quietus]|nr:hypothetical protein EI94DRAFT_1701620 [Lactarius quietus]